MPRRKAKPTAPSQRDQVDPRSFRGERNLPEHVKSVRLDEVEMLMAAGVSSSQLAEHCWKAYGVKERSSRNYAADVRARWLAEASAARPELRRRLERMLELCYARAMERSEIHAAVRATVELARLHGMYRPGDAPDNREPEQHVHQHLHAHATVVQLQAVGMTPIERNAEIAALEAKRRAALSSKVKVPAAKRLAAILDSAKGRPS